MGEHTPGPWEVHAPSGTVKPDQRDDRLITAGKLHVAETFQYMNHDMQNGPSIANAYLVAAAPDLLAACEAIACA